MSIYRRAGLLALALSSAHPALAAAAPAKDEKAPSVFLQCDGRTGHVSAGESFLRLALVTATAGLSEAGMASDNASKRAKGAAGVAACDAAVAKEGDNFRRTQLALARSLHFAEDKQWVEAAAAARAAPATLDGKSNDWALNRSAVSAARYLEALFLVRANKIAEAETAAWDAINGSPYNVMSALRAMRFVGLSRELTPAKRSALEAAQRVYADMGMLIADEYAAGGDYAAAMRSLQSLDLNLKAVAKEPSDWALLQSTMATYAALGGDVARAKAEFAKADAALKLERGKGAAARNPTAFARSEEALAFAEASIAQAEGQSSKAAEMLAGRGSWVTVDPGLLAALVGKVAAAVPAAERKGVVAKGEAAIWTEARDARIAVLSDDKSDASLWTATRLLALDVNYQRMAGQVLTGSTAKPKWLMKPRADQKYDFLTTIGRFGGLEASEGLLYHAALIAKARGKEGFVVLPPRSRPDALGVRFLNAGEGGQPRETMVLADQVIAEYAPRIREAKR